MIFYDTSEKRRYFIRFFFVVVFVAIFYLIFHFFNRLDTSPKLPEYPVQQEHNTDQKLVITFDDGPNEKYTLEILDILENYGVFATFFYTGINIQKHPGIVQEVISRGHIVGNHSFTHSKRIQDSPRRLFREINSTNNALRQATGYETILYRPPFLLDLDHETNEVYTEFTNENTIESLKKLVAHGYIIIDAEVDSNDWKDISEEEIIQNVYSSLADGHILLFHDSGGDRTKTLRVLPIIIEELQAVGYEFVSLDEYLGLPKDTLMPKTAFSSTIEKTEYATLGFLVKHTDSTLGILFVILLALSVFRILFIFILFIFSRTKTNLKPWRKGVSVIIPAFNEENNIEATLKSILFSTHQKLEIIVVDDGSTDKTAEIVNNLMTSIDKNKKIKLIQVENGGKARALNIGIVHAKYKIIFAIDGDTVISKEAVAYLATHFNDPKVGAVAGRIEAITDNNLIALFQRLEYTVHQNIDKIAFSTLNAVNIIPGAIGAWRTSDIKAVGGYNTETLVEDQDLTLAILKLGKKSIYEPRSVAYTEVPSTTKAFFKQRYRWIFGTFQCIWKYRQSLFSGKNMLSWVVLPYNLIYMAITPFLLPIMFGVLVYSIYYGESHLFLYSFLTYLVIDSLYYIIGLYKVHNNSILIAIIPFQRIYYKIIITLILILSSIKIIEGTRAFWNKLERSGSAQAFFNKTENYTSDTLPTNSLAK